MDEIQYYEELEVLVSKLQKAKDKNDADQITKYLNLLNELWQKGNKLTLKDPPPKI
tara:strand:+ start:274 stop:441 length:168 start_codon:yes stop_codon:yes gene_type:complete